MRRVAILIPLVLPAASVQAAPMPRLSDAEINSAVELGAEVEARGDGDLNGDGHIDTAFIIGSEDSRDLYVVLAAPGTPKPSRSRVGTLKFDGPRVGKPSLTVAKGVLSFSDTAGKDVRMSSILRYRYDPARKRMRLIGMDAHRYNADHSAEEWKISWNLITGELVSDVLQPDGTRGPQGQRGFTAFNDRLKRPSGPVYMEQTPDPEFVMIDIHKTR